MTSTKDFFQLKKNLKKDFSAFKNIKVALLADTASQFLGQAIRSVGFENALDLELWEADFNQIERQVFDSTSELYTFNADVIIVFQSSHKLLQKYNKLNSIEQSTLADQRLEDVKNIVNTLESNTKAKLIYYNYSEIDDAVFGNFANKVESSFLFQERKLNYALMTYAAEHPNFYLCDLSSVQNKIGRDKLFQASVYVNTEMVLSIDALPLTANKTVNLISAMNAKLKKCVILDLDNTTWGGIIGDDGVENIQIGSLGIGKAFTEFQHWVKKLKNRGIIVAVCSKNTESIAKVPFETHPDMVLKLDDISVFVANWENKADNIRYIQQVLNIGFDSMVFLDDNPFERNIVRDSLPEVLVPELPEDPADYLEYMYGLNLFETLAFSKEDAERTKLYQIEAKRKMMQKSVTNETDFLKNLEMVSEVNAFNTFNTPRIAQLSQRSNQFNLRTIRYTDLEIEKMSKSKEYFTFAFGLEDKFGDHGLICVIILKKESESTLFIDTWFMSCRVLKRGMEGFVLNTIASFAKENGYKQLKGEYIQTPKNEIVKNHYLDLGFDSKDKYWLLDLDNREEINTHIKLKK